VQRKAFFRSQSEEAGKRTGVEMKFDRHSWLSWLCTSVVTFAIEGRASKDEVA
jgi:hypothetical protein